MSPTTLVSKAVAYETKDGEERSSTQYTTTVPKELVDAMDWSTGDDLVWSIETGTKLGVTKDE